jgi:hypothetical protein
MKRFGLGLVLLYLFLLFFTRFYNLDNTARFGEDESGFLVRMHQIYKERKLTLVGQVNEQGTKVFSSLSIYLLLPFAIIGKFDPVSTFYGAAFWGILTVLVMLLLSRLINKKFIIFSAVLLLVWFPLLQTGRWAWNPNFVFLWISLGLICYLQNKNISYLFSGIFLGLSVHQHYYAIFPIFLFSFMVFIEAIMKKRLKKVILLNTGILLTLIPFIIFDLRHPPGIFLLGATQQAQGIRTDFFNNLIPYAYEILKYQTQSALFANILGLLICLLIGIDIKNRNRAIIFLLPCLFQIITISLVAGYFFHYFFPIIPFFFVWLISPRRNFGKLFSRLIISILIITGILQVGSQLNNSVVQPNVSTIKKINFLLQKQIQFNNLNNVNIAVLSSPDHNISGRRYRDLLLIPNNFKIKPYEEYSSSDDLFVISANGNEEDIRRDPAFEINYFREGMLKDKWPVEDTNWLVYLFANNNAKK